MKPMQLLDILSLFPLDLFLALFSVTLLIKLSEGSGVFMRLTDLGLHLCRRRRRLIPFLIFVLTALLSALGIGNIATTALVAPAALSIASSLSLSPFLMTLMVVGGANAAVMSPISPTGILAAKLVPGTDIWSLFWSCLILIGSVHLTGFFLLGGTKWIRDQGRILRAHQTEPVDRVHASAPLAESWTMAERCALGVLGCFFTLNLVLGLSSLREISYLAFGCVGLGLVLRISIFGLALKRVPWSFLALICTITTTLNLVEKLVGFQIVTDLASQAHSGTVLVVMVSFIAAFLSVFSSSSGVVMPLFLPMIPALLVGNELIGSAWMLTMIVVASHLVDCSPFSSLGALAIGSIKDNKRASHLLFRQLIAWGLAMVPVAAGLSALLHLFIFRND
jgi:di/tricarboxylate transporter